MSNEPDDLVGEPIYIYTDEQAVRDGLLVAITGPGRVNRVTRAVFDHFTAPIGTSPITGPVTDISTLMDAVRTILESELKDGWRIGRYRNKILWLIPNESGGFTLMFPEDY